MKMPFAVTFVLLGLVATAIPQSTSSNYFYYYQQSGADYTDTNKYWQKVGAKKYKFIDAKINRTYKKYKVVDTVHYNYLTTQNVSMRIKYGASSKFFSTKLYWIATWQLEGFNEMGPIVGSTSVSNMPAGIFVVKVDGFGFNINLALGAGYDIPVSSGPGYGSIGVGGSITLPLQAQVPGSALMEWTPQPVTNSIQVEQIQGVFNMFMYIQFGTRFQLVATGGFNAGPIPPFQNWYLKMEGNLSYWDYKYFW